jgi:UDP-N-acetylglucosamine--N-acetylmuramyl-(pentapeptide) pyrophosphoryl-undecaprenol N-acetylglucosamine transferase
LKDSHPDLKRYYLGLKTGKEAELITSDLAEFHPISSGKLRRYFALETIPDFFRFVAGIWQSFWLLGKIKPRLVFSSGGFVALPVAMASWLRGIPLLTHETDSYPGLANRMMGKMATKIFLGFESARRYFEKSPQTPGPLQGEEMPRSISRIIYTGNPVSRLLLEGSRERALQKLGFSADKKVLLVMGGSQGAQQINELVWGILPELMEGGWQVVHLTGKGKAVPSSKLQVASSENTWNLELKTRNYRAYEYITNEYADFLAAADLVISRAGGNSLAEMEALGKIAILIPLPLPAAAGDHQRKNAEEMAKRHPSWKILDSQNPSSEELLRLVRESETSALEIRSKSQTEVVSTILEEMVSYLG